MILFSVYINSGCVRNEGKAHLTLVRPIYRALRFIISDRNCLAKGKRLARCDLSAARANPAGRRLFRLWYTTHPHHAASAAGKSLPQFGFGAISRS